MSKFAVPDFTTGELELRVEGTELSIYGTAKGLRKLAEYCLWIVEQPNQQHLHLDTTGLLTKDSAKGAIAIFEK